MAKTQEKWKAIDEWSHERVLGRMKVLRAKIEQEYVRDISTSVASNSDLADYAYEAVYLLLMILRSVIKEKGWKDITPLELFEGVYQETTGYVWAAVHQRFAETKSLVDRYKTGSREDKSIVKPKLASRGLFS